MTGISYHLILTYYKMPKIKLKQTRFLQIFGLVALIEQKETRVYNYTAVAGSGKVWPVNQVNHTSWVVVVTQLAVLSRSATAV